MIPCFKYKDPEVIEKTKNCRHARNKKSVDGPRSRKIGAAAKIIREKAAATVAADDDLLVFSIGFCIPASDSKSPRAWRSLSSEPRQFSLCKQPWDRFRSATST